MFPPLAGSDYLKADRDRAIRIILKGIDGPIKVNGSDYKGVMPSLASSLNDQKIADVLTYVLNSWGNAGDAFSPDDVSRVKNGSPK